MRRHSLQRMQWIGMTKFASRRNRIYKLNVFPLKFPGKYGEKTENEIEQDVSSFNWKGRWNSRLKTTNWINRHCRGKFELCGFFIFKSNLKRFLNFMCSFLFQFNLYIHRHPARWAWMRTTSQSCVIFRWRKKMIQNLYERQWKICIKMILRSWRIVQFVDQKKKHHKTAVDTKKSDYDWEFVSWTTVARNFHAGYGDTMLPVVPKPIDIGRNRQYFKKTHCA